MIYELELEILINKIKNMSLEELFLFDPIKAVEKIIGATIDMEEPTPAILVPVLYAHNKCFKTKFQNK